MTQPADPLSPLLEALAMRIAELAAAELARRMAFPDPDQLLTLQETADLLGVSVTTIRQLIRRGEIPVIRMESEITRIRRASLDAWMREREQGGQPCHAPDPITPIPDRWTRERKTEGRKVAKP